MYTSNQSDLATDLARVATLLRQSDLAAAETACRSLLTKAPRNAAATHLLGLIRKVAGDAADGERLLRDSVALEPRQADFRANLANLLRQQDRLAEAQRYYLEALQLDPRHQQARLGLVRTLNDQGQHVAAERECRLLLSHNDRDPVTWTALAMTLRDQQRLAEAEAAYRQAIAIDPAHAPAHHNLGSVLHRMDRAEESLNALTRAQTLGVSGFEIAFNRGMALLQLYRIDEAEAAFAEAVRLQPLHGDAQVNLARLRFMRGDQDFTRDIAAAVAAHRSDKRLPTLLGVVLTRAGDLAGAEALLRDLISRNGPSPQMHSALAAVLLDAGRLKEAESEALTAVTAQPHDATMIENLVTILLSRGRPDDALPFIRKQRQRYPLSQGWIAYEATAARLTGDPLYRELYDYDRLIRTYDLESPPGWSSMAELNAALLEMLNQRHAFSNHPLDQSLRNGSQTARNLLTESGHAIRTLLSAFELPIEDYQNAVGTDPQHLFSARNLGKASIVAAWSVQLRREGFHVNHFHPQGWLSSAYYVAVPPEVSDENLMSGWLKFGEPRYPVPGIGAEGVVQPRAARLVLFPSYMWHGTNPIHGTEPRTTIAFDAVPPLPR